MVFISEEYIDISSEKFGIYDSVCSYSEFAERNIKGALPLQDDKRMEYSKFAHYDRDLKPVV